MPAQNSVKESEPVRVAMPTPAKTSPTESLPSKNQTSLTDTDAFLAQLTKATSLTEIFSQPHHHVVAFYQDGDWVTMGDILVNETQFVPHIDSKENVQIARIAAVQYWPDGIVPYDIDPRLDVKPIKQAMDQISQATFVKFVERTGEADFVFFRQSDREECLSFLGKQGGEQDIKLHPSSCGMGSIIHEILHALGLVHEQSREDRDKHVDVLWDNIEEPYRPQFQKMSASISMPVKGSFDFESIMLYDSSSFAIPGKFSMRKKDKTPFVANRKGLSPQDIEKIKKLYPKAKTMLDSTL
jgi:hypothetical protein